MAKKQLTDKELELVAPLKLKKAKVPLFICLKLAIQNMWKKKFRYLVMFLICGLSLTFLSITIELNGEKLRQNVYTMIENGYRFTDIYQHVELSDESIKENYYNKYASTDLDDNSYNKIKEDIDGITIHEYNSVSIDYVGVKKENSNYFYTGTIDTLIKYDPTNTYELVAGRLPNPNTKEILITDYLAAAFSYFDIYSNCNNIYDYLNQRLSLTHNDNYQIVGIVKTNYQQWSHFATVESVEYDDKENYSYLNDFIYMNSVILNSKYFDIEKTGDSNIMAFNNYTNASNNSLANWSISKTTATGTNTYAADKAIGFTNNDLSLVKCYRDSWRNNVYGRAPQADNEIVISYTIIKALFGYDWQLYSGSNAYNNGYSTYRQHFEWWNSIQNSEITITFNGFDDESHNYTKTYKIVGISDETATVVFSNSPLFQVTNDEYQNIYYTYNIKKEKILVELPNSTVEAYDLFNRAFSQGYVIDVWSYQNDIDNYTVDPFLDLASKAGLFIFAAFTMGIMWTIISIEIVDSKKEIGILRSIGLSGSKVAFIFIFQSATMILLSYFLGVFASYQIIPYLNVGITDELNKITLYMYSFTYRTPLYLAIFVIVMTLISTIIPLIKILSNRIIDVINERDN